MNVMTRENLVFTVKSEDEFLQDQAQAVRAAVYELLSSLLARQPDEQVLERLRHIGDIDASDGKIAMGWELMKQAALKQRLIGN